MKYLITGISGFVAGHYLEYLFGKNPEALIIGIDRHNPDFTFLKDCFQKKIEFYQGSILEKNWVFSLIEKHRPDYIINLASYSSVASSWLNPVDCFVNNTNLFLNLVEAVRIAGIKTKILSVGSSEEYGIINPDNLPLTEESLLNPISPYAVARVAQEQLSKVYSAGYQIQIICTRSFNHIGPRQRDQFVASSFAKQVIEGKKGKCNKIVCGNLAVVRDFIDVRDVVRAYDLLLDKGKSGEIYNVCSGEGHELSEILKMLQEKANTNIPIEVDPKLLRPIDNTIIVGSWQKLKKDTGFQRKYSLPQSLTDLLEYWQSCL